MRHFTSTQDWTVGELQALLDQAAGLKSDPVRPLLQGRTVALLFLNRSLRTRASFQIGAAQLGATAIVLEPGNGVWGGAPQCRGDRCGPGRSELRGDRRGGEPATRAESADAGAAGVAVG